MASSRLKQRKVELLLERIEHLPVPPGVARHLLTLTTADHLNAREIQQVVESDASLAARAIQLAARAGHPPEALTSIEAVFRAVGVDEIAAGLLSVNILDGETQRRGRLVRLWRHNLATAMAAQVIASRIGTVPPDDALLAALLHDIGLIALPFLMPKAFSQVLERVEASGTDVLEAERDLLGVDHAVIGKRLAQRWGFSETLQNVIWLHHQPNVPSAGTLAQVTHLADLIACQEGFAYHPSLQIRDNTAEVAERLGLSGIHAEQIGQQVASVIDFNARSVGMEDEPTPGQLYRLVVGANSRLASLYRAAADHGRELRAHARRADLLVHLNSRLAACRSPRQVLETVAETVREALGMRLVVPYLLARQFDYIEGVRCTEEEGVEQHFLYEVSQSETLKTLLADHPAPTAAPVAPMRAERVESWLFERVGEQLGPGPFYTVPMVVEGVKVGGIVFAWKDASHNPTPQETAELVALAGMAGVALKRAQAEADLVGLSEELAEVNRELEVAQEARLQQRNVASLSEMAAGAAHEINNPLAVISGRAQQLAAKEKEADRREMLQTIIDHTTRISDIIAELHRFARPPAPQFETVDPVALAREVVADFQGKLGDAPVALSVEAHKTVPPIRVDRTQAGEALQEVLQNAVEACAEGGNVTVMVQPLAAEQAVRFAIVDDGPGMDPQIRARAFDPFYSGYEAGRHRGLGLPRAFRAVQANNGQMALESQPGRGTTVRITFRAEEPPGPNPDVIGTKREPRPLADEEKGA